MESIRRELQSSILVLSCEESRSRQARIRSLYWLIASTVSCLSSQTVLFNLYLGSSILRLRHTSSVPFPTANPSIALLQAYSNSLGQWIMGLGAFKTAW